MSDNNRAPRVFLVDVESTAAAPCIGVMTEFGVVDLATKQWFGAVLYDSTPDPDVPARPVVAPGAGPNPRYKVGATGATVAQTQAVPVASIVDVLVELESWLTSFEGRPLFVSDNPAFDFMWIADAFAANTMANPFGHTGRRIGDLAAGLSGTWTRTSAWKRKRRTAHDHTAVNDAMGNAEALETLLAEHNQTYTWAVTAPQP